MSDRYKYIFIISAAVALFILTALIFDRDLLRYPLIAKGRGFEREKAVIISTLKAYNKIMSDFYASDGMPVLLNEFPGTKAIRHGLFRDIGFIRDSGRVLVYDLADITEVDVRITSPRIAEAVVFEEWNYVYQRREDRTPLARIRGLGQGFRYRLIRQAGAWMVDSWVPVDVEEPEEKGFLF